VKCEKCGKHEATQTWVGEGGVLAYTHGFTRQWCRCCVLKAQLEYAERQTKRIPVIKKELAKRDCRKMEMVDEKK